jgi:secreted trypsin-like serine protease
MVHRRSIYFFLLVIGWHSSTYSMVGGAVVGAEDSFKKHVVGIFNTTDGEICSGTLIRPDVVLTAAHCFDMSDNPGDYIAVFGLRIDPSTDMRGIPVAAIKIPAAYSAYQNRRNSNFDIALMKLAKKAPSGYSSAVVATKTDYFLVKDETYIAAGYGITKHSKTDPGVLRKLTARGTKLAVTGLGKYIELQALGAGPCSGDSGSPLFKMTRDRTGKITYSLIGVQSQAIQRAVKGKFQTEICEDVGLYTNVALYKNWLEENADFRVGAR